MRSFYKPMYIIIMMIKEEEYMYVSKMSPALVLVQINGFTGHAIIYPSFHSSHFLPLTHSLSPSLPLSLSLISYSWSDLASNNVKKPLGNFACKGNRKD